MKVIPKCCLLIAIFILNACNKPTPPPIPVLDVPYIKVRIADVPLFREFVGQTFGQSDIDIYTRVDGLVTSINFLEGSRVKKGQLLFTIDPAQYEGKVAQAQGQLAEARSILVNSQEDLKRIRPLADMNAVSKRDLDAAISREEAARGKVEAAKAFLDNQKLELSYTKIVAPIEGVIGISKVRVGDYVSRLSTKSILNTISSLSNVRVRFSVSENDLMKYVAERKAVGDTASLSKKVEVDMLLSDGSIYPHKGVLNFADRAIDPTTGTLTIEAEFPNAENSIRPGQFVRVRLVSSTVKNAMLVPQRAVQEMQGIYQVYIIDQANTVQVRVVEMGQKSGNEWMITKGVDATDRIALLGNQFIQVNSKVNPVDGASMKDSLKNK